MPDSEASIPKKSGLGNPVQQPLENIGGGGAIDDLAAPPARDVRLDHLALDRGGGHPLVPKCQGQVELRQQVVGELPDALDARSLAAVERQRQADDEAADTVLCDVLLEAFQVVAKARAADGGERR